MFRGRMIGWTQGLFAAAVLIGMTVNPANAVLTISGDDFLMPSPSDTSSTASVELYLADDTGGPVSLGNYQLRIALTGPNAGTDVKIIGGGQTNVTGNHPPAVTPPILASDVQIVDDDAYFLATENTFDIDNPTQPAPPFNVADGAGLGRIDFEVQPGVTGVYTFEILTTSVTADTALVDGADFLTPLAFGTSSPTLTLASFLLGDVDGSGQVNNLDISPFVTALSLGGSTLNQQDIDNFVAEIAGGCFQCADTKQDTQINNLDISEFIDILAASGSSTSTVPEPASLTLMAAATLLLVCRWTRKPFKNL